MGVSGQRHAPAALYPRYLLDRRLGGIQSRLDTEARGKILFASAGDRTSISRSSSTLLDTVLTELPRLSRKMDLREIKLCEARTNQTKKTKFTHSLFGTDILHVAYQKTILCIFEYEECP
jgi:hypothetical protein